MNTIFSHIMLAASAAKNKQMLQLYHQKLPFRILFTVAFAIIALALFTAWKEHRNHDKKVRKFRFKLNKSNSLLLSIVAMVILIIGTWVH